jgi:hypothetical protein
MAFIEQIDVTLVKELFWLVGNILDEAIKFGCGFCIHIEKS